MEDIRIGGQYTHFRNMKMKISEGHQLESINDIIKKHVSKEAIVLSDKSNSYSEVSKFVDKHITKKSNSGHDSKRLKMGSHRN